MRPSSGNFRNRLRSVEPMAVSSGLVLAPLDLRLKRQPGPLLAQIQAAVAAQGVPLRWAITAVQGDAQLIEAIVLRNDADPPAPGLQR